MSESLFVHFVRVDDELCGVVWAQARVDKAVRFVDSVGFSDFSRNFAFFTAWSNFAQILSKNNI